MGLCVSKGVKVAPIEKTDVVVSDNNENDSFDNTSSSFHGQKSSSDSVTVRGHSRPDSHMSKRPMSQMSRKSGRGGGMYPGMGRIGNSVRPQSRPGSHRSFNLSNSFGKGERLKESFRKTRLDSFTAGDLPMSSYPTRQHSIMPDPNPCETSSNDESSAFLLRVANQSDSASISATQCPCCLKQYSRIVHIPYLLLCGHTFCSNCINYALKNDPSFLKCGICAVNTPIEPQSGSEDLIKNEPILDLIESKDFASVVGSSKADRCAECDREVAMMYCSECSASYCEACNKQQHTGSRVRSRHKPVSISLKPRPQPTCKKHPGQSCVLYCETERQTMCVLCKFYGHHKFHNYQLLNNSASTYRNSLSTKLSDVDKLEKELNTVAKALALAEDEIKQKATEAQENLERNFEETRYELTAALEHREAMLLSLLDKQVEKRESILHEERMELAFARARAIAAKEEATRLLDLNPISALLARKHVDSIMETVLKQTATFSPQGKENLHRNASNVRLLPVGLRPKNELSSRLQQVLNKHGAILQLPEKPEFTDVKIYSDSIRLRWQLSEQNLEVTSDRTLTYSLQCFADVPFKFRKDKFFSLNKRFHSINPPSGFTPDSGFQDGGSDISSQNSESKGSIFPSIPTSLHSSRNISLITMQTSDAMSQSNSKIKTDTGDITEKDRDTKPVSIPGSNLARTVKPVTGGESVSFMTQTAKTSGVLLNLPPLLKKVNEEGNTINDHNQTLSHSGSERDLMSGSNISGILGDTEDTPRQRPHTLGSNIEKCVSSQGTAELSSSSSSLSDKTMPDSMNNAINMGRYCKGYAFEEIYCGHDTSFTYSGIVTGATYYFRLRCHNAAGEGPWSDTYKCSVIPTGVTRTHNQ